MKTLNKDATDVLRTVRVNAVTDVTGFGLFGHAHEVADRSGVQIRLESERFPAIDGALDLARKGIRTSGDPRNRDFAGRHLTLKGVPETLVLLGYDPQTAGGLLVSLPAEQGPALEAAASLPAPHRHGGGRRGRLRRVGSRRHAAWDDSRALSALPSGSLGVHARRRRALR
jgi:selenide,water dikinase